MYRSRSNDLSLANSFLFYSSANILHFYGLDDSEENAKKFSNKLKKLIDEEIKNDNR